MMVDYELISLLTYYIIQGKGAFGSVVKARNKIDSRIYAGTLVIESCEQPYLGPTSVKKVRLKTMQRDTKIFREVNALSRLSHRFIVRYYTTWVETSEPTSTAASDDSGTESSTEFGTEDGMTSVPETSERHLPNNSRISFDLDDLAMSDLGSGSKESFPSIHFGRSTSPQGDSDSDEAFGDLFGTDGSDTLALPVPMISRTLYIQMVIFFNHEGKQRVLTGLPRNS